MGAINLVLNDILGNPSFLFNGIPNVVYDTPFVNNPNPRFTVPVQLAFSDDFTFSDLLYTSQFPFFILSDAYTIDDTVNINLGDVLLLFEDILIIDSIATQETIVSLSLGDAYILTDNVKTGGNNNPFLGDSLSITDEIILFLTYDPIFNDSYTISDSTNVNEEPVNYFVVVGEAFLLNDSFIVAIPNVDILLDINDNINNFADLLIASNSENLNTYLRRYLNDVTNN